MQWCNRDFLDAGVKSCNYPRHPSSSCKSRTVPKYPDVDWSKENFCSGRKELAKISNVNFLFQLILKCKENSRLLDVIFKIFSDEFLNI